jgi:hypothetical protein
VSRRRIGALLGALAVLCLLGAASSARAAHVARPKVELSVAGAAFSGEPNGPLMDTHALAPGVSISADLGVRSGFDGATAVSLQLVGVRNDDNGCTRPETRVDTTCGRGQGDLEQALTMTVAAADARAGDYQQVWSGSAEQLAHITTIGLSVPKRADRWLRITATVPATVGNIVQSDTFGFGLRVTLAGSGGSSSSGVAGAHTSRTPSGHGTQGLAATGFELVLFLIGAALLIASGTALLGGTRRRRATSDGSSTAR